MIVRTRLGTSDASVKKLRQRVAAERPRMAKLLGSARRPGADPVALEEALDALGTQHEELQVADEELREQLDELTRLGIALEAERERYADLFALAPDAHLVTDRRGVIHEANEAAATLLRIDRRFLRAKPLASFVCPSEGDALHLLLETTQKVAEAIELRVRPRGAGEVLVDVRVRATSQGTSLIWILREVRGAAISEPERALRDRTELLERERRLRADLERTNLAKDRFIAVLAHDLRAPLNAILGWTQLLQREHLDTHGRARALGTIERNAHAQESLIAELLDISRLDADKLQLTLAPVDLGVLVQRAVESAAPAASEQKIEVACTCADGLTVIGDRTRLDQILTNVLSNALKYTPAGGKVTVCTERAGDRARVIVTDSGKGIAPDILPLVFQMYIQDRTELTARRGLGLGLHIVKQLVQLHDGTVEAASEGVGKGTTITIYLPLQNERIAPPSEKMCMETRSLARLHILVVDDEPDERELIGAVLERAGAEVMCANSVEGALAVFEAWRPDVVVSDIAMPDADGCTLLAALRKKDPHLAAVAVSGFTSETETGRVLAGGFDAHVGKPVDATQLVDVIDEAARTKQR